MANISKKEITTTSYTVEMSQEEIVAVYRHLKNLFVSDREVQLLNGLLSSITHIGFAKELLNDD